MSRTSTSGKPATGCGDAGRSTASAALPHDVDRREIKLAACYILVTPALVLIGTAVAMALPDGREAMTNIGAHGFSVVLYAYTSTSTYTSASNNNGSAFAGFGANIPFFK